MRIVHIAETLGSGLLEYVIQITRHLPEDEHLVIVGNALEGKRATAPVLQQFKAQFPFSNVQLFQWEEVQREVKPLSDLKSVWSLRRLLNSLEPFDVVHLHSSKAGFIGRLLFFLTKRKEKIFYTPNGAPFLRLDVSLGKRKFFAQLERFAHSLAGDIVCCSKSEYEAYVQQGMQPVGYINNGTETSTILPSNGQGKKIKVCTTGRLSNQKNPALFNQIAQAFVGNPAIEFVWIGEGELRSAITSPNIIVTGWLTKDQVREELLSSQVYLSTALWEGLPFAVLEAMSCGKALLLKKAVGNVDLVEEGQNGSLFDTAEQAVSLLNHWMENPDRIHQMGEASLRLCDQRFNARNNFSKMRELYQGNLQVVEK
ncbi:glycosyltransferase [Nibribacter ruber]|uniref:Glycosyltransferase n=1 Tax=Nibribacter ruber TaxID=2698458 RepID=A0A6P1NWD5_9BACT|nr:glycosyltransferase [Nibribacter ruber]QHL86549.1 glycosyltransferase [Nibribacter ruber]